MATTKLAQVMEAQGRRWDWLAREVGVSRQLVSFWKYGQQPIAAHHIPRIAHVLGVHEEDILEDSPRQQKVGVA